MACWGCGREHGHPDWCPERSTPIYDVPPGRKKWASERSEKGWRTYKERKELERLVKEQEKEMRLRRSFQPAEWPAGQGRTRSLEWALETHQEPFMRPLYQSVENRL